LRHRRPGVYAQQRLHCPKRESQFQQHLGRQRERDSAQPVHIYGVYGVYALSLGDFLQETLIRDRFFNASTMVWFPVGLDDWVRSTDCVLQRVEYVRLGAFNPSRDYRQPAVDRFTVSALVSAACFVPRSRYLDEYLLFAVWSRQWRSKIAAQPLISI
jgi:hypothetical protein